MNSTNSNSTEGTITETICIETIKPLIPTFVSRSQLPSRSNNKGGSIWSVLKKSIGKDLTRVTVPLTFNEPLSFLQRLAEYMEYVSLIKQALKTKDPVKRMELIAAFCTFNFSFKFFSVIKTF
uniref:Uncharacterized protein n=1 Tax=Panagrolaimus superbus TaxID=310955 RepID=A0A914Z921_9BILA